MNAAAFGYSINDTIQKELCSISYVTIDDDIRKIVKLGPNALLANIDKMWWQAFLEAWNNRSMLHMSKPTSSPDVIIILWS